MNRLGELMTAPVHRVTGDAPLARAAELMRTRGISCLPVVDGDQPIGAISRTDLLHLGQRERSLRHSDELLTLPDRSVGEVMSAGALTLPEDATVAEAAAHMVEREFHRVFVVDDGGALIGVFSAFDLLAWLREQRVETPIEQYMSSPLFTVRASDQLITATQRIERAGIGGLVVVEKDWPVGVFTQLDALRAQALPAETPVDRAMSSAVVAVPAETWIHRAAAQAYVLRARRVLATRGGTAVGILTGIDFARCAAELD